MPRGAGQLPPSFPLHSSPPILLLPLSSLPRHPTFVVDKDELIIFPFPISDTPGAGRRREERERRQVQGGRGEQGRGGRGRRSQTGYSTSDDWVYKRRRPHPALITIAIRDDRPLSARLTSVLSVFCHPHDSITVRSAYELGTLAQLAAVLPQTLNQATLSPACHHHPGTGKKLPKCS